MNEDLYICDHHKNTECKKTVCSYLGKGYCYQTTKKEFSKSYKTNQDKLAEILRNMDPKVLTEFWTSHTYVEDCNKCPAHEYCDKHMLCSEDGLDRIPDENGEILECKDIFERWLKEEYSE